MLDQLINQMTFHLIKVFLTSLQNCVELNIKLDTLRVVVLATLKHDSLVVLTISGPVILNFSPIIFSLPTAVARFEPWT
jgi:hypothetical protein